MDEVATSLGEFSGGLNDFGGETTAVTAKGPSIGHSILKYGKTIPFIELFEGLIVIGFIILINALTLYFIMNTWTSILQSDPSISSKTVDMTTQASQLQSAWIAIGIVIILLGALFYFLHRRAITAE